MTYNQRKYSPLERLPWCIIINLLIVYVCYGLCRVLFVYENHGYIMGDLTETHLMWRMVVGSLKFDTSAIFLTNIPYLLLVLVPLHVKENKTMQAVTKWTYVIINSLCIIANLCDCIYYSYTQRRATVALFSEFSGNTNIAEVVGYELYNHWYLTLSAVAMIAAMWVCYRRNDALRPYETQRDYYVRHSVYLVLFGVLTVCGIRGDFFRKSSRPLALANAHQYVEDPSQTGIVVNTPFSLLRTSGKKQVKIPTFYADDAERNSVYYPLHTPSDTVRPDKKNVVILIVESFAEEFIGARNRDLDGGTYKGYTTFTDSLLGVATTFEHTYCNSWVSIDAMPAVLSSIPKMYNAFILSPYSLNDIPGLAKELGNWGYETAFFHGAENSSMGFQAFAKSAGFQNYYGRTEYDADPRFGGEKDFDGTWAIWDEEFLQYFCAVLSQMQQPFLGSVFTATSHHPFAIPERYKDIYPEEGKYEIHKCIRYTDNALREFFNTARHQPWFDNTIFIITADHASSKTTHDEYMTTLGKFRVPIIIYDPSGQTPTGTLPGIMQQIDIMPTVLGLLGYDRPYIAFGDDIFATTAEDTWAFNWHNIPQYVKGDYLLQYEDLKPSGLYRYKTDVLQADNLLKSGDYDKAYVQQMEREIQAMMQTYDILMRSDSLRVNTQAP